jgi:hypothetical protein
VIYVPMLADNPTIADLADAMADDRWVGQRKVDGARLLIVIQDGAVSAFNRDGAPKTAVPAHIAHLFRYFTAGTWVFDGELVAGNTLWLFDMAEGGTLTAGHGFGARYLALDAVYRQWAPNPQHVNLLPVVIGAANKQAFLDQVRAEFGEGIILRHVDGRYEPGRRSKTVIKNKFVHEVDAVITATGLKGADGKEHNNVEYRIYHPTRGWVVIGRASANGKCPAPAPGDVWTVRFMNVGEDPDNPRLYQPRLMMRRYDDKPAYECTWDQLTDTHTVKELTAV